jgi:sulfate transport system ATP-binding protein
MTVSVQALTKAFSGADQPAAVAGVSFEAPTGSVTAVLGPSGCGKTTLLRLIAGLEQPDSGSIHIGGRDVSRARPSSRGVGFVFQSYALFGHMTVADNVAFGLRIRRTSKREVAERVAELLTLVQLEGFDGRFPSELSGGQRQRVALARALAVRPKVLLLDEPFGALDARVRTELREFLMRLLERTKVTTLLVTHDQDEALELAAQVVLLNEGCVLQAGSPSELYDKPACAEVAAFLGGTNVLRGFVTSGRADLEGFQVAVSSNVPDGEVEAYVRPSDVRVRRAPPGAASRQTGKIQHITRVGPQVKLELELTSGLPLVALCPKVELDALGVQRGDRVLIELATPKVFPYSEEAESQPGAPSRPRWLWLNRAKRFRPNFAATLLPKWQ